MFDFIIPPCFFIIFYYIITTYLDLILEQFNLAFYIFNFMINNFNELQWIYKNYEGKL